MSDLADAVLPLIRTRRGDLYRWGASNEHGRQMHIGVDILESAAATGVDAADVYAVTHKALASAIMVIKRADDSSGIIGDACRRLLKLHPIVAERTNVPAGMEWRAVDRVRQRGAPGDRADLPRPEDRGMRGVLQRPARAGRTGAPSGRSSHRSRWA